MSETKRDTLCAWVSLIRDIVTVTALVGGAIFASMKYEAIEEVEALNVAISEARVLDLDSSGRALLAAASVSNVGTRSLTLSVPTDAFLISRVARNEEGHLKGIKTASVRAYNRLDDNQGSTEKLILSAGTTRVLPFLAPIESDGLYHLSFRLPVSRDAADAIEERAVGANSERKDRVQAHSRQADEERFCYASRYILVKSPHSLRERREVP